MDFIFQNCFKNSFSLKENIHLFNKDLFLQHRSKELFIMSVANLTLNTAEILQSRQQTTFKRCGKSNKFGIKKSKCL